MRTCSATEPSSSRSRRSRKRAASRPSSDAPWEGMPASCSACSKSPRRAFVRQRIAISSSGQSAGADALDDERRLDLDRHERPEHGLRAGREARCAAPARAGWRARAPAASSGSSAPTGRPQRREPLRQRQQVRGAGAREAVDRLVVVADRAELVAVSEPAFEQRLLEQVDVLVLVDREGAVALTERRRGVRPLVVEADRQLEQVLEVGQSLRAASPPRSAGTPSASGRRGSAARGRRASRGSARAVMRRLRAHSISVARSPAGRNLNGAGSELAMWRRRERLRG